VLREVEEGWRQQIPVTQNTIQLIELATPEASEGINFCKEKVLKEFELSLTSSSNSTHQKANVIFCVL